MPVKRIYVEKKKEFAVESASLLHDIQDNLNLPQLSGIRILNRYDIEGIEEAVYQNAKNTIFSEPAIDLLYEENFPVEKKDAVFAVEYLPGQYDQRADSAMQCIQVLSEKSPPVVQVAKVFVLSGSLNAQSIDLVKDYCINPVDSREASLSKPDTLEMNLEMPQDVLILTEFRKMEKADLTQLREDLGLAMTLEDFQCCQDYFNAINRDPTITEIRVIDTYWSDHCRHTTFLTHIGQIDWEEGFYKDKFQEAFQLYQQERNEVYGENPKNITLMDLAVLGMKALKKKGILQDLDESDEINACSIVVPVDVDGVTEDWLVMFKNETHNHPTEIEPFGGAATCLGGAIRDPLSGRSYVYQAMRVTGSGDPRQKVSETLEGKLPQRKITTMAAHGYSSYGNQIGLATGQVVEVYHPGYVAKRMEIGAVIGAAKKSHVYREKPEPSDVVILVGGRTGRDGCGGATGSSKEHTVDSILTCGAEVQKGNPPVERKLQRLFRNPEASKLIKKCNDFGAGGVAVAIGELADGLRIQLDAVPKKYDGLDGTELAISESQERMAVVVKKEDAENFIAFARKENLEATVVAEVTEEKILVMQWRGQDIVRIDRSFLDTNGAVQKNNVFVSCPNEKDCFLDAAPISSDLASTWIQTMENLNTASQKGLGERFDATIGASTVLMPFGGKRQITPPEAMVAKIPLQKGHTNTVTMMSYGFNPDISSWSPFHGAVYAVVESIAKIVATGGDYKKIHFSFQEYFERLGEDPRRWGKPFAALLGAFYAQMQTGLGAIGGKDSMSGTFMDLHVPPSLVSFAVATGNAAHVISPEFKKAGSKVVYMKAQYDAYGLPNFKSLLQTYQKIYGWIKSGRVLSASTVKQGGVAEAVAKMCFGNEIGFHFQEDFQPQTLFSPQYGSILLEMDALPEDEQFFILGETTRVFEIKTGNTTIDGNKLLRHYEKPLESVFPSKTAAKEEAHHAISPFQVQAKNKPGAAIARPRVFIPVFPGTNCEYDSRRAFEEAGAIVEERVVLNGNSQQLDETIKEMAATIKQCQIIMLAGGFSAGDEPDGSAKFIASIFRNPYMKEAVEDLLSNRDGLMLGICNGFQALVKLGLLPYGRIQDMTEESPTLTYNEIGRHVSTFVTTRVVSNLSPWLWQTTPGDIHSIPVSHGEGRFIIDPATFETLCQNGQIATQYVDTSGQPTNQSPDNPNGSYYAIEGITSQNGRILGKMGHSERVGNGLYKNIPGNKDQKIFISGIAYFS